MNIAVIIGTTRAGRVTPRLAKWVMKRADEFGIDANLKLIDLKDYDIPLLEEAPWHPDRVLNEGTKKWLDELEQADGYIIVTAEYNHGIPAVLKNALDHTSGQMIRKPAVVVSHGVNNGARANELVRIVLNSNIGVVPVPAGTTFFGNVHEVLNDDGSVLENNELNDTKLKAALDNLMWYTNALLQAKSHG